MSVVAVRDLAVSQGERAFVSRVSFDMTVGEVTALVGESGSGKTTTGLTLLGEAPADAELSGRVQVADQVVDPEHPPPPGTVGYIPQHPSAALNPVRRIGSVLREIARTHVRASTRAERARAVDERVATALRRAQLPEERELLRRYPHQLSGGQQQRVVLAHTLLGDPRVVVADEPTTGQDVITRSQLVEEFRLLGEQGIAVLLLTHDLDLVRALAHQLVVMRDGRSVESGPSEQVLGAPRHEYTRQLIDAQPDLVAPEETSGATTGDPMLSVRNLEAGYRSGGARVSTLNRVSLDVRHGDAVALVGRSGSGKTTFARCVAGLHPFRSGEVLLDNTPLAGRLRRRSRHQLARVQYVFQDARASFNEFVPVLRQVARTAERLRGVDAAMARERALAELTRLGVPEEVASRLPESLSGGELRRVALARAMLSRPDVLICDELTSGLDTVTQAELLAVLDKLQRDTGCALLVITHDLAMAAGLVDRLVIMSDGHIVEEGSATEMLTHPSHEVTRALVSAAEKAGASKVAQ